VEGYNIIVQEEGYNRADIVNITPPTRDPVPVTIEMMPVYSPPVFVMVGLPAPITVELPSAIVKDFDGPQVSLGFVLFMVETLFAAVAIPETLELPVMYSVPVKVITLPGVSDIFLC
jgi:hypothetical protein